MTMEELKQDELNRISNLIEDIEYFLDEYEYKFDLNTLENVNNLIQKAHTILESNVYDGEM